MNWQKKKIQGSRLHQSKAFDTINALVIKRRNGRNITLVDDTVLIDFASCSYLGLDLDKRLIDASMNNIYQCGVSFPIARTRMRMQSFVELDRLLNKIFCGGYSTVFSSLHVAHLGLIPLLGSGEMPSFPLASDGIVFILDKAVHACIQINRGLMEQFGEVLLTDILSPRAVEEQFQAAFNQNKTSLVITDSIGSMGGVAPVALLMEMAEKYNGYVYFDDAHGTSVYGKYGAGYVLQALDHIFHPRLILTSSLSKGYGANSGVIVLPTEADEQMVRRHATTYLFGNPTPLAAIDAAIASAKIHLSGEIHDLQNQLQENIHYFDSLVQAHVRIINRDTVAPVRGIFVGDEFKAIECTTLLRQSGFAVTAAMYPTVAKGQSMLRVALSSAHSKEQIASLCERIKHCSYQIINPEKTHVL